MVSPFVEEDSAIISQPVWSCFPDPAAEDSEPLS